MIILWLKIMYYKIAKALKGSWSMWCRIHAEAGGETTGPRARHEATTSGEIVGVGSAKLRELIELGLVHEPDGLGDLRRVEQWREDWARREAGDPSACPCGGRHYPSADACRWCRCHDPRNVHHTEGARGIMQVIKPLIEDQERLAADTRRVFGEMIQSPVRPSKEIVCCSRCGHPQHGANGGRCAFLVTGQDTEGPLLQCRCRVSTVSCTVCSHDPHGAGACSALTDDGAERCGCGGVA